MACGTRAAPTLQLLPSHGSDLATAASTYSSRWVEAEVQQLCRRRARCHLSGDRLDMDDVLPLRVATGLSLLRGSGPRLVCSGWPMPKGSRWHVAHFDAVAFLRPEVSGDGTAASHKGVRRSTPEQGSHGGGSEEACP